MAKRNSMSGGFFLVAAILIGFVWGVVRGEPSEGVLIGTGVGIALAVLLWLLDRRRR